jgi:Protein phosphatase inhibitor 2 (IPP-2)
MHFFYLQHRFKQKRQQHYNEYQMMQQWKRSHSIDEDDLGLDASAAALNTDDADMNGDDNGHEAQQLSEQSSDEQQQQAQQHAGSSHSSQQNGGES